MVKYLVAATLAFALATPALAGVTMTFDNLPGANGDVFTSYTENGFTLTKIAGYATKTTSVGDPAYPSEPSGGIPAVVNNSFGTKYALTAGGSDFTFDRFGLFVATNNGAGWTINGELDGQTIYTLTGFSGTTSNQFTAINVSSATVDRVTLAFDSYYYGGNPNGGSSVIDRLGTTIVQGGTGGGTNGGSLGGSTGAVPEPATWAMMIGGFGLTGAAMRRRRALAA